MRVLMVCPYDICTVPCMARPVGLAEGLCVAGHEPILVYFVDRERRRTFKLRDEPAGVECHGLEPPTLGLGRVRRRLDELARRVDVIHFQKCHPHAALPAITVAQSLDLPVHYDWDDDEVEINRSTWRAKTGHDSPFWLGVWTLERLLPTLSTTISYSSAALHARAIRYGVSEDRLAWVPVGADLARFRPDLPAAVMRERHHLEGPVITYVGQLEGVSFVERLLEAAATLRGAGHRASWLIIGGGFQQPSLEQLSRRLRLEGDVHFLGYRPADEIPLYLAASDVLVALFEDTPATRAKSPLKVVEYLASGRPIVASTVGEVPRMIEGAGRLVGADSSSVAEGIAGLLADPARRLELGRRARAKAEETYNWNASARRLLTSYERALHGRA